MVTTKEVEFDKFADNYDTGIGPGVIWSGEPKEYYARTRIAWLAKCLKKINFQPKTVMDFGCGTGTATAFFFEVMGTEAVVGVDNSSKSLEKARLAHGSDRVRFALLEEYQPHGQIDLVYCNGVFHHIPPAERAGALNFIHRSLRPEGAFGLWENNPWNPITRMLMHLAPVDRNAITLSPPETRRLVSANGFKVQQTDFMFIFPKMLSWLRSKEHLVARWPFGIQYQVFCTKAQLRNKLSS